MNENLIQSALKHANFSLTNIIISLCVIALAVFLWFIFKRIYNKYAEQQEQETGSKPNALIFNIIRVVVIIIVLLTVLQINNINVSSLVAGLGVASAIVGLALQDYLKDVIMGMHIVRDTFFREGDVVVYDGSEGIVTHFNMRTTKVRFIANGEEISISNRNISEIRHVPDNQLQDINIGLPYEEDHNRILSILEEAAEEIRTIEGVNSSEVRGIQEFAESAIIYRVRLYCYPPDKFVLVPKAQKTILEHLNRNGVTIPFPQMDVHVKPGSGPEDTLSVRSARNV